MRVVDMICCTRQVDLSIKPQCNFVENIYYQKKLDEDNKDLLTLPQEDDNKNDERGDDAK